MRGRFTVRESSDKKMNIYIFITVSGHMNHYKILVIIIITNIIVIIIIHYTLNIKNKIIIIIIYQAIVLDYYFWVNYIVFIISMV